jgi:sterol desaturase/sphingolipid hydroxylase (fatty acid hydroxylase superfamily)
VLGPIDLEQYLIAALVFIQLEMILPLRPSQKRFRAHWGNDVVMLLVNGAVIQLGLLATAAAVVTAVHLWVPAGLGGAVRSQPVWLQVIEVIVLADLGFYAAHRLFHAVPWLWRFHAVHHSIDEMDWLAGYRVHPLDQILTKTVSYLPLFVLGFSDAAMVVFVLIFRWQATWIHANTKLGLGPLRLVLATPHFHHWHHANAPEAIDKNFAGQLPLLDWLAGTLHLPSSMPARYGTDMAVPTRYDRQMLFPFRRP